MAPKITAALFAAIAVVLVVYTVVTLAQSGGKKLDQISTLGGGVSSGDGFRLQGNIAVPGGAMTGGGFELNSGFIPTGTSGKLTSTNVEPESLVAGAVGEVDVSFTATTGIPVNGKIVVTFPSAFTLSSGAASGKGADGTSFDGAESVAVSGDSVTITRSGGSVVGTGSAITLELTNIKNPPVSGSTGTYTIRTTNGSDLTIDQDTAVTADTITAGALTSTNVQPESLVAGATGDVDVSFTIANPLPADGKIVVTFPSGFTLSSGAATAIGADGTSFDGAESVAVTGDSVTITRSGGSQVGTGSAITLELTNIRNPQVSGSTGTYKIKTTNASDAAIDEDTAVTADTITAGALTATNVQPESLVAGAVGDVDVSFTIANPLPADGKIVISFPSGFTLSSGAATAVGADGTSFDGVESVAVSGDSVTITRSGDNQVGTGAAITLELTNVGNPTVTGDTGTYSIKTTTASGVVIDQETAVGADTIIGADKTAPTLERVP